MLAKPFAYKGPTDHLSQFFSLPLLYKGVQLLLNEMCVDWRYDSEEQTAYGIFLYQEGLLKTQIQWPLKADNAINCCGCSEQSEIKPPDTTPIDKQNNANQQLDWLEALHEVNDASIDKEVYCEHLAALAIETKMHLERLPQPIKQANTFANEQAYLADWLSKQHYDPFPNMARHRVAYLLDVATDKTGKKYFYITVYKSYLTQSNEYQKKSEFNFELLKNPNLPKFVSLTDQQILFTLADILKHQPTLAIGNNGIKLEFKSLDFLLPKIIATGRCFWKSCHRQALNLVLNKSINKYFEKISDDLYLEPKHSFVVKIISSKNEKIEQLDNIINKNDGDIKNLTITPKLTMSSELILYSLPNQMFIKDKQHDIDVAKFSFLINDLEVSLSELLSWVSFYENKNNSQFIEKVAGFVHQLDWLPSVVANLEIPLQMNIDIGERLLEGDFSHWFILICGLHAEGWKINFDKAFRLNQRNATQWYSKVITQESQENYLEDEQENWFELEIGILVDGNSINILPIIVDALKSGRWKNNVTEKETVITLNDGKRVKLEKDRLQTILNNLKELTERKPLNKKSRIKIPINQFSRLAILEKTLDNTLWQNSDWLKDKTKRLNLLIQSNTIKISEHVNANLREYQNHGVAWLQQLRKESFGGILADDMGLGKTLQTLVHIQMEKDAKRLATPAMIVAPTSLLGNWIVEAKKFTPKLSLIEWSGSIRTKKQHLLPQADLVITSYGLLLRDAEILNQLNLSILVLDEAQAIKNSRSRIAKHAYAINARQKICLTGTPLENHLGELWSLFNFIMPNFLGSEAQFKRFFREPIEKDNDMETQKVLTQRVSPFLLRRTKDKVAVDLPAKTEIEALITLSEIQSDLYETVRLSMLDEIHMAVSQSGGGKQMVIGNALLRLRQICCHSSLFKQTNIQSEKDSSAKLDWLESRLPEMIASQRRILIFSSFTSMLDIIAAKLEAMTIDYLLLTGKTQNRQKLVEQFQLGKIPVFLISLKAGGSGLNLTQADTVIHFDPWWNPAAEKQASDRAHRIGQDKPVFVYKLISQGTVEERIQKLQSKKSQLAEKIFSENINTQSLSSKDWQALLAPLEEI